jgi:photosystem II stability/assembly factor-like uncharacterized protein
MRFRTFLIVFVTGAVAFVAIAATSTYAGQSGVCVVASDWRWVSLPNAAWTTETGTPVPGTMTVVVEWRNPGRLYAATLGRKLLVSDDCGATWHPRPIILDKTSGSWTPRRVAVDPLGNVFVDIESDLSVVSADGGQSWEHVRLERAGFPAGAGGKATRFVIDPQSRGTAYTFFRIFNMRGPAGLYKTEDGGRWWRDTGSSRPLVPLARGRDDDSLFFHGGTALIHSPIPAVWTTPVETVRDFGSVIAAVTQSVDKSHLWVATDDGLLHLSRDQGYTWSLVDTTGGPVTPFVDLAFSPFDPTIIYAVNVVGELWTYREPE